MLSSIPPGEGEELLSSIPLGEEVLLLPHYPTRGGGAFLYLKKLTRLICPMVAVEARVAW